MLRIHARVRVAAACAALLVAMVAVPATAVSKRIVVDCTSDPGALQTAVAAAAPGAVLLVSGSCNGSITIDKNLTVQGKAGGWTLVGNPSLIITAGPSVRVADVSIAAGIFRGIQNAGDLLLVDSSVSGSEGYGVVNSGTLELRRSVVGPHNKGGIYNTGDLTMRDSSSSNNSRAGAQDNLGLDNYGDALLVDSEVNGNKLGGIHNSGSLVMRDSTISDNQTSQSTFAESGGGFVNAPTGSAVLVNVEVTDNVAPFGDGGGIINRGVLTLRGSTVSGNSARLQLPYRPAEGGGVLNSGTLIIRDSTIRGNSADIGAGIMNSGDLTVAGTIISDNTATTSGGGIYNSAVDITLRNVTFANNVPDDCSGC